MEIFIIMEFLLSQKNAYSIRVKIDTCSWRYLIVKAFFKYLFCHLYFKRKIKYAWIYMHTHMDASGTTNSLYFNFSLLIWHSLLKICDYFCYCAFSDQIIVVMPSTSHFYFASIMYLAELRMFKHDEVLHLPLQIDLLHFSTLISN